MSIEDDSSASSTDSWLLKYNVMSQPSPSKHEETTAEETEALPDSKDETPFVKTDDPQPPSNNDDAIDEAKAQRTATLVMIDKKLESPSSLYWHVQKKKKKTTLFPCRIPPDEGEYIGT